MKTLFLQISDMHCKISDGGQKKKIDNMVAALKSLGPIQNAALIFSGDLSDSALENEFKVGRRILGYLLSNLGEITNSWIPTFIVPGNHDMYLPQGCRGIDEIMNWNHQKCLGEHIEEEIHRLDTFLEYAHSKNCFINDNLCDVRIISLGDIKIQVCLLNSAIFSTKRPDDKQAHYFPPYVGEKLVRDPSVDLKLTIMHHSYEWFEWNSKEMLRKRFATDDIVFLGHDHLDEMLNIQNANGENMDIVVGGKFGLNIQEEAAFNAIIYDTDKKKIERHEFNWKIDQQIFGSITREPIDIKKESLSLTPCESYLDNFLEDKQQLAHRFTDYYVFPKLVPENKDFDPESSDLIDENVCFNKLLKDGIVRISGKNNSGKSSLIRYLYFSSIKRGFSPLFIEKKNYDSHLEKMFQDMFNLQYGEKRIEYDRFMQLDFSKRIIFIDDFDKIKNEKARENLFQYILTYGGLFVYSTSEDGQNLEDIIKERLQGKSVFALRISPFLADKREELVLKITSLDKFKNKDQAQTIIMMLNYMVQSQAHFFTFTPGNIIQYIKFFLTNDTQEDKGAKTLSLVFETNIRNSIIESVGSSNAFIYLAALEHLANSMYFEFRNETITPDKFELVMKRFNKRRRTQINAKHFFDSCQKAKILQNVPSSFDICFSDKNAFAYFVAKYVNTELERDPSNQESISYIMNHICFGMNDTIVLFLSYIRSNSHIILNIASTANNILEKYPELNFDTRNIPFLTSYRALDITVPTAQDVKEHKQELAKIEEAHHEAVKFRGIFDYDEADVEKEKYRVLRALKYTQLIGQALVDQYGTLESDELDKMISSLYRNTQKILYAVLKPYQDHYEELIAGFSSFAKEIIPNEKITDEEIRKIFTESAILLVLNIMNDIAYNCSNSRTISLLSEFEKTTSNHQIQSLMMTENIGNTSRFVDHALLLNEIYNDNPLIRSFINQIACKHFYYMSKIDYRQTDRLISGKIFSTKGSKAMLIQHQQKVTKGKNK